MCIRTTQNEWQTKQQEEVCFQLKTNCYCIRATPQIIHSICLEMCISFSSKTLFDHKLTFQFLQQTSSFTVAHTIMGFGFLLRNESHNSKCILCHILPQNLHSLEKFIVIHRPSRSVCRHNDCGFSIFSQFSKWMCNSKSIACSADKCFTIHRRTECVESIK